MKVSNVQNVYHAKGIVIGMLWGGQIGFYKSRKLAGNTRKEIEKAIEEGLNDGSLDGGMGFEYLTGAIMTITRTTTITISGKKFSNYRSEEKVYGGDISPNLLRRIKEYSYYI